MSTPHSQFIPAWGVRARAISDMAAAVVGFAFVARLALKASDFLFDTSLGASWLQWATIGVLAAALAVLALGRLLWWFSKQSKSEPGHR